MRDMQRSPFLPDAFKMDILQYNSCSRQESDPILTWDRPPVPDLDMALCLIDWRGQAKESLHHWGSVLVHIPVSERILAMKAVLHKFTEENSRAITGPSSIDHKLAELRALRPGWDGGNAERPSEIAVNAARLIVKRIPPFLKISDIDADVIGGLALWVESDSAESSGRDKWAWFSCRNSGKILLTLDEHKTNGYLDVSAVEDLDVAFRKIIAFLNS